VKHAHNAAPTLATVANQASGLPGGVIFDMDGVLVDSYGPHFQSWQELGRETGAPFSEAQFAAAFGRTSREIISEHWRNQNLTQQRVAELDDRKEALYRRIVQAAFPAMDGATELVAHLHQSGFVLAVGSSGPRENIDLALEKMALRESFQGIVSGADVTRGKPDPQVFLRAAESLQIPPAHCVVIEDAPLGVSAAHAADMPAVALLSCGRVSQDFQADPPETFVQSLRQVSAQLMRDLIRNARPKPG
jgi:beta-phosphoglucomutase